MNLDDIKDIKLKYKVLKDTRESYSIDTLLVFKAAFKEESLAFLIFLGYTFKAFRYFYGSIHNTTSEIIMIEGQGKVFYLQSKLKYDCGTTIRLSITGEDNEFIGNKVDGYKFAEAYIMSNI